MRFHDWLCFFCTLSFKSLGSFLKEIKTFNQQGHIKMINKTVNMFIMYQHISISNNPDRKSFFFFTTILSSTTVLLSGKSAY